MQKKKLNPAIDESQIEKIEADGSKAVRSNEELEKEMVTLFATIIVNNVLKECYEKGNPLFKI